MKIQTAAPLLLFQLTVFHPKHAPAFQPGKISLVAAGDEDLAAGEMIEQIFPAILIQLAHHIIEQNHRPLA